MHSMLLEEAAEKRVSEYYARIWIGLKLRFTAKYFSEGALQSDSAPCLLPLLWHATAERGACHDIMSTVHAYHACHALTHPSTYFPATLPRLLWV